MNKKILCIILGIIMILSMCACNYNFFDTSWDFQYAYLTLPDGSIKEVEIDSWSEDSTSVTIKSEDGNIYCVSMMNCFMTKEKWEY